jgi:hypothetical protein
MFYSLQEKQISLGVRRLIFDLFLHIPNGRQRRCAGLIFPGMFAV